VKIIYGTAKTLHYIAAAGLLVLMMLQVINMIGRYFFNSPLQGTTDLGSYMLLVITALGLGWAALERRHISVGLVMDLLPSRVQLVTDTIILTITCAVSAFVSYLNILAGITWQPRSSSVLNLPFEPFRYILGAGFAVLAICTLRTIIENFRHLGGTGGGHYES
jgi:TRAP-type C4-dicarboxylate transport system permease small subunit